MFLFVVAALLTFGFITLLQFTPISWFFVVLILMHVGIFTFIASRRVIQGAGNDARTYCRNQYLLLLPYLLILLYTFACRFGLLEMHVDVKTAVTLFSSI